MAEDQAPREGWFRSPGGVLTHSDGPGQVRAYTDRGYTKVDDDDAAQEIGDGLRLTVDGSDGAFDAEAVRKAVAEESTSRKRPARKRSPRKATAKPAAATPAPPETPAGDSPPEG